LSYTDNQKTRASPKASPYVLAAILTVVVCGIITRGASQAPLITTPTKAKMAAKVQAAKCRRSSLRPSQSRIAAIFIRRRRKRHPVCRSLAVLGVVGISVAAIVAHIGSGPPRLAVLPHRSILEPLVGPICVWNAPRITLTSHP